MREELDDKNLSEKKINNKIEKLKEEEKRFIEEINKNDIKPKKKIKISAIISLFILLIVQILLGIFSFQYKGISQDKLLDEILLYEITVEPQDQGVLKIEYNLKWKVLSGSDNPLTWVKIGMANPNFSIIEYDGNVKSASIYENNYVRCDLDRAYSDNSIVYIKFSVYQRNMLCYSNEYNKFFYEFVPGWFDDIPIDSYLFKWKKNDKIFSTNSITNDQDYWIWRGSLNKASFVKMNIFYTSDAFSMANVVDYKPFVKEKMKEDNFTVVNLLAFFAILFILYFQISIIDNIISYRKGRGFMKSNNFYKHINGENNPRLYRYNHLIFINSSRNSRTGGGGGGSHGCACACACACAGGGRAGCSEKDMIKKI